MRAQLALAAAVLALAPLVAAARPPAQRAKPGQIEVAITVDDLTRPPFEAPTQPPDDVLDRMVAAFARHHLPPVTGFLNGDTIVKHPEDRPGVVRWLLAGNLLGNHTYSHLDLAKVGVRAFLSDVDRDARVLERLMGPPREGADWRVFRYPFLQEGATVAQREAVRTALFARGYRIAEVTIDFEDWAWFPAFARCTALGSREGIERLRALYREAGRRELVAADRLARRLFDRPIRQILLLHAGAFTSEMLDDLIDEYESAGVRFVSLADALEDSAYHLDPRVARSWGSPFLYQLELALRWQPPPDASQPDRGEVDGLCR